MLCGFDNKQRHRRISRTRGSNWEVRCKDSEPQESSLKESKCSAVLIISSGTGEYQEPEEVIGKCAARIANRKRVA